MARHAWLTLVLYACCVVQTAKETVGIAPEEGVVEGVQRKAGGLLLICFCICNTSWVLFALSVCALCLLGKKLVALLCWTVQTAKTQLQSFGRCSKIYTKGRGRDEDLGRLSSGCGIHHTTEWKPCSLVLCCSRGS